MSRRVAGRDGQEAELYAVGFGDPRKDLKKGVAWTGCILGNSFSVLETEPPALETD